MPHSLRLVLIEWEDSFGCTPHWRELSEIKPRSCLCQSVGWLAHDGEDAKVIIPHFVPPSSDEDFPQGCGDMTIPVRAILRVVDLIEVSASPPQEESLAAPKPTDSH